jgi:hypothetical protein
MPGLVDVLSTMTGVGATLLKGTIISVSTGRLTILIDGDVFSRVPYLDNGWVPVADAQVYVLNQQGFGMLAIGSPMAVGADEALPPSTTLLVDPEVLANWQISTAFRNGTWIVPGDGVLVQTADYRSSGAFFYDAADLSPWAATELASVEIELEVASGVPQLVLHRNAAPNETLDTYGTPVTVTGISGTAWVPLPLTWGRDLVTGAAQGVVARSQTLDAALDLHGTLRLTSL